MKSNNYVLYIEGTPDDTNGDLRQGFSSLLSQELEGNMPRIIMADGKSQAINKFKRPMPNHNPLLIVDLDNPKEYKLTALKEVELETRSKKVFFMVQEMEAWFISQPQILDSFYSHKVSSKIKRKPAEYEDPSGHLKKWTKNHAKKERYNKVRHGVPLLKLLNLNDLMKQFEDVNALIITLKRG